MFNLIHRSAARIAVDVMRAAALGYIVAGVPGWDRLAWLAALVAADFTAYLIFAGTVAGSRLWGR